MEMEINVDLATLQVPVDIDLAAPPTANLFVPPLPISKTCVWKTVDGTIEIAVDVYLPPSASASATDSASTRPGIGKSKECGTGVGKGDPRPVMLFIHGGAWLGSNRSDYCRPLFYQFLELGFVVTSMDYRLRPETSLEGQLDDVRDVEGWLRGNGGLEEELRGMEKGVDVDAERIVVVGASAGAHLALLTVSILLLLILASRPLPSLPPLT